VLARVKLTRSKKQTRPCCLCAAVPRVDSDRRIHGVIRRAPTSSRYRNRRGSLCLWPLDGIRSRLDSGTPGPSRKRRAKYAAVAGRVRSGRPSCKRRRSSRRSDTDSVGERGCDAQIVGDDIHAEGVAEKSIVSPLEAVSCPLCRQRIDISQRAV
jgi:hypothetical protein